MADSATPSHTLRGRPVVGLPPSAGERVLTVLAAATLIAAFSVVGWYWDRLPARVPMHFDAAGRIDSYGGRVWLLALLAIFTAFFIVLTALERVPRIYNYPWHITAENAARQYRLARRLIVILKLLLSVLCLLLVVAITAGAMYGRAVGTPLFPVVLAAFGVMVVGYFVAAYRAR